MPDEPRYSLTELADLAGVTPRTVRYYVASGLLPSVGQPGPGAKYGDDHLDRLRLIKRLQRDHLPLAEIRRRMAGLDEDDIRDLAGSELAAAPTGSALDYIRGVLETPASFPAPPRPLSLPLLSSVAPSIPMPTQPERSSWERIALAPDVELHVRRPSSRTQNKRIDRLVTIARELLEEE